MLHIEKTNIGLDISDYSVELVQVAKKGDGFLVHAKNRASLPAGIVVGGLVADAKALADIITDLAAQAQPQPIDLHDDITVALPDAVVYTHVFTLRETTKKQIDTALPRAITRMVPLPAEAISYAYSALHGSDNTQRVLVAAADKATIAAWQQFFEKQLDLKVKAFDVQTLALPRVVHPADTKTYAIVDMGAQSTQIVVVHDQEIRYNRSVYVGAETILRDLNETLGVDDEVARETVQSKGMGVRSVKQKNILKKHLQNIGAAVNNAVTYNQGKKRTIEKLYVTGGLAAMKGSVEVVQESIALPIEVLPLTHIDGAELVYVNAIGIALQPFVPTETYGDVMLEAENQHRGLHFGMFGSDDDAHDTKKLDAPPVVEEKVTANHAPAAAGISKETKQLWLLAGIIIVGVLLVFGAFRYRAYVDQQQEVERQQLEASLDMIAP